MDGVASGLDHHPSLRTDGLGHSPGERRELVVGRSDNEGDRHRQFAESWPQRVLRTGPTRSQACGQSCRPIGRSFVEPLRRRRQRREQRVGDPVFEERPEPVGIRGVEPLSNALVGQSTLGSTVLGLEPGRCPNEDEPLDQIRSLQGEVQRHSPAHRIADVGRSAADLGDQLRGRPQISIIVDRFTMAGGIDQHHLMVGGETLGNAAPAAGILGEAMQQNDPRAVAEGRCRKCHDNRMPTAEAEVWFASNMQVTDTATFCATLVDEWVHQGLTDAFVAPGSRSTPLALALAGDERFGVHVFHDERSASFAALGHGLATGQPAIVLCTSGTAAAHFHAAVIEAHLSSVPLIVCTANRPTELWDVGAPQTIDQTKLYGDSPRWFFQPGPPDGSTRHTWRPLARRSVAEATGWSRSPGPVHLDLSFRDPLAGSPGPLPDRGTTAPPAAEVHAPASITVGSPADTNAVRIADMIRSVDPTSGGVLVAGRGAGNPDHILRLGERLGWPVIADHRSGCRVADRAVAHSDAILRNTAFADAMAPAMVIRLGEVLTSKVTEQWLSGVAGPTVVATAGRWTDPAQVASLVVATDNLAEQLLTLDLGDPSPNADRWMAADAAAALAIAAVLAKTSEPSEPGAARAALASLGGLNQLGPPPALVVSSSMPVRDVEWYGPPAPGVRVLSNRGANGIDGVIATAIGVALSGAPTICLIGDVAMLHDSSSLTALARRRCDLTILVVDNDGGGIFSFLPQRSLLEPNRFEQLFGTPHGTDLVALAAAHGIEAVDVVTVNPTVLTPHGVRVLRVATDRDANTELHAAINAAVGQAVAGI